MSYKINATTSLIPSPVSVISRPFHARSLTPVVVNAENLTADEVFSGNVSHTAGTFALTTPISADLRTAGLNNGDELTLFYVNNGSGIHTVYGTAVPVGSKAKIVYKMDNLNVATHTVVVTLL